MYTLEVRRLAILYAVLLALSYSLIAPALLAFTVESNLPACCRRDGKHQCSMDKKAAAESGGPALRSVSHCSQFPAGKSGPSASQTGAASPVLSFTAPVPAFAVAQAHPDSRQQPTFPRTARKRGPPVFNF